MARKCQIRIDRLREAQEKIAAQRRGMLKEVGDHLGNGGGLIVSYFADAQYGILDDYDVGLLEDLLQAYDRPGPLVLILHSPGGTAHAAEHMIRVCRTYGGGAFSVIVPKMAKSAATLVCLGAAKIYMGPTAELGPVDPQIYKPETDERVSAVSYVDAYSRLMYFAEKAKGKTDAYCQQLTKFDDVFVAELEREIALSKKLALDALLSKGGMWSGKSPSRNLVTRLKPFTDIEIKGAHERPIFFEELHDMGLKVQMIDRGGDLWPLLWSLYQESSDFVSGQFTCMIETSDRTLTGIPVSDIKRNDAPEQEEAAD